MSLQQFSRHSALEERHRALGTQFEADWNDMPIPQCYATDPYLETQAVRYHAGLFDVSALRILDVSGGDATAVLNEMLTSDISRLTAGQSHISNIVDDNGSLIDDVLVYCDGPDRFRLSHGSGSLEDVLLEMSAGKNVQVARDDDVHILSLQGPEALAILEPHTPMNLSGLAYFQHARSELFGRAVSLARGGYSAERGYEVFCSAADAVFIWDSIMSAGAPHGIMAASWSCLDIVRVEGALLFFPFDMPEGDTTPWEVGADWTVDLSKPSFRGKQALMRRRAEVRVKQVGVVIDHSEAIEPGARLMSGDLEVGVVNSTTFSQHLMQSLALCHVKPELSTIGTALEVQSITGSYPARVARTPFYDPMRLRTHPLAERSGG
jgi:aminomethyltransferase